MLEIYFVFFFPPTKKKKEPPPTLHTLPKPHEPKLKPKLSQRACKANALREIGLKILPSLKKVKNADTQSDRKERK